MPLRRSAGAALVGLVLCGWPSLAAQQPRPDQRCETRQPIRGYTGGRLSQSFTPTARTVGRVDLLMGSPTSSRRTIPVRLVARRRLPDGSIVQTGVLAHGVLRVAFSPYLPTWAVWRLPSNVAVSAAGPAGDQLAVQLDLPANDDAYWLNCDPYAEGIAYAEADALQGSGVPTELDVGGPLPRDLAFREYATSR